VALHQNLEVDLRGVELRTIHAGKFAFVRPRAPAAAAHARAVHHDGVQADHGLDSERPGNLRDGPHHGHRADGQHKVDLAPGVEQVVEFFGDQAFFAVAAVVVITKVSLLALRTSSSKDHHFSVPRPFDEDDVIAGLLERVGRGQRHGCSYAAGQDHSRAVVLISDGFPSGPTMSRMESPVSRQLSSEVVLPTACTAMVTVPASGSEDLMVSGMRSPFHSTGE